MATQTTSPASLTPTEKKGRQFILSIRKTEEGWTFEFQLGNLSSGVIALFFTLAFTLAICYFLGQDLLDYFLR
jgi:hypothetical protein